MTEYAPSKMKAPNAVARHTFASLSAGPLFGALHQPRDDIRLRTE
jgi:hypothetical protein